MKQTAVEWLEKICNDRGYHLMSEYFEQAKQMEKEQIIEACQYFLDVELPNEVCEQYYNKTFKSEIITDINLDENDIKKINDYVKNETFKSE